MNSYASSTNIKHRAPLSFRVAVHLVALRLRTPKALSVSFEFVHGATVVCSKNFHKIEANAYETVLREIVDVPVIVAYDPRKGRFTAQAIDFALLSNHGGFSKKMAVGSINVAQILNGQSLVSREQIKLDKCVDKAAQLNTKIVCDFRGPHVENQAETLPHMKYSVSTIR